jgi:sn-glycerol 3-phosphate transport system substrate-binding protein
MQMNRILNLAAAGVVAATLGAATRPAAAVELQLYYPVAVGGPVTKIVDDMVARFHKENPDIKVTAVYAGNYTDTMTKAMTAMKGGQPPQLSVLLSTDVFTLIDEKAIIPIDDVVADKAWLKNYYPAFMANGQIGGKTWSIPFQRSTIVLYWNKDAFKEAGLDPEKAPASWDQMVEMGKKLVKKDASGNTTRWGVEIPTTGYAYWMLQALAIENGQRMMNEAGNEVYLTAPKTVAALDYWVDLSRKHGVMPTGTIDWATLRTDFLEGKTAMMWHTTGNLTAVKDGAKFNFGVAMLPAKERRGSPTGGGSFYIFKNASPEQQKAAVKFIQWMTTPERAAEWSIKTGYVAVSPAAYKTPEMEAYAKGFPAALVARDQLEHAVPELSVHENGRIYKFVNDAVQAAVTGAQKSSEALGAAQQQADRVLRAYK